MSVSAAEQQEVRNYQDVLAKVSEWPLSVRAALIRDVAETMVEEPPALELGEPGTSQYTPEELEVIYRMRHEWEENRRRRLAGEFNDEFNQTSPFEGMNQEEVLAYMKAEWERNRRRAHENYVPRPPRITLADVYGIGNAEHPGPSDEEVKQWLHEHKMEKYG